MTDDRTRIGLLGCGNVGSEVARLLTEQPRLKEHYELVAIAVRDARRPRPGSRTCEVTTDPVAVASRPDVDVVIELMGGLDPALPAVEAALQRGTAVVTANKTLIAEHGEHLAAMAARAGVPLRFEGAVAAAVPVVETLRQLVRTDRVTRIEGVLNGTCTFVLSEMEHAGSSYDQAIRRAIELGYAEADPTRDVDGSDAADKLVVLAQLAWGPGWSTADVQRIGIDALTIDDVAEARAAGRTWRLVAAATASGCLVVEPRPLPIAHPFARLTGPTNAITITAELTGEVTLTGTGAGGTATASAILADLDRIRATTTSRSALATTSRSALARTTRPSRTHEPAVRVVSHGPSDAMDVTMIPSGRT